MNSAASLQLAAVAIAADKKTGMWELLSNVDCWNPLGGAPHEKVWTQRREEPFFYTLGR